MGTMMTEEEVLAVLLGNKSVDPSLSETQARARRLSAIERQMIPGYEIRERRDYDERLQGVRDRIDRATASRAAREPPTIDEILREREKEDRISLLNENLSKRRQKYFFGGGPVNPWDEATQLLYAEKGDLPHLKRMQEARSSDFRVKPNQPDVTLVEALKALASGRLFD